jgi:hypothetical protein
LSTQRRFFEKEDMGREKKRREGEGYGMRMGEGSEDKGMKENAFIALC